MAREDGLRAFRLRDLYCIGANRSIVSTPKLSREGYGVYQTAASANTSLRVKPLEGLSLAA